MIKELHLVIRTIYSFLAVLALSSIIGLNFSIQTVIIGLLIFANSFLFQYYVLHFVMKYVMTSHRSRLYFLFGWLIFCFTGIVISVLKIPQMEELKLYESIEAFTRVSAIWGSIFVAFSAAFVAAACARRAFGRHGALG